MPDGFRVKQEEERLMSNHGKVRPTDDGQTLELVSAILNSLPRDMTDDEEVLDRQTGAQWSLAKKLAKGCISVTLNFTIAAWQSFYHDYLSLDVDLFGRHPPHQPGFERVIVIPQGLTPNKVVTAMKKHFSVYTYVNDLDRDVPTNERDPKSGTYALRVRNRVEADEELKNLSANQIANLKLPTLTLLERLVYELKYYSETKSHLDVINITRCSGSRSSGGFVPYVLWHGGRLDVGWCDTDDLTTAFALARPQFNPRNLFLNPCSPRNHHLWFRGFFVQ